DGDVVDFQAEFFSDALRQRRLDPAADVLHRRENLHRAVVVDAHFAFHAVALVSIPDGLGDTDAALDRAGIGIRRLSIRLSAFLGAALSLRAAGFGEIALL